MYKMKNIGNSIALNLLLTPLNIAQKILGKLIIHNELMNLNIQYSSNHYKKSSRKVKN